MKTNLRKVSYSLLKEYSFDLDTTDKERAKDIEDTESRIGLFHKWIEKSEISPQTGLSYTETYGF